MDDVAGLTRHVIDSLMAFRRLLANKHPRFRAGYVCSLAEERDRREEERAPFAAHPESPAERCAYQSVATFRLRSGVSLRVFIEREGEGS